MSRHERHGGDYSLGKSLKLLLKRGDFSWSVGWWQVQDGIKTFFWPIFLLLIVKSYSTFGAIASLVMLVNSVAVYWFGKQYDKRPFRRLFPVAGLLVIVTWVMRFLARTTLVAGVVDGLSRLVSPAWWMKIRRQELLVGEKSDSLVFAVAHEMVVSGGYLVSLGLGYSLLKISGGEWVWLSIPAILGVVISTWTLRKK